MKTHVLFVDNADRKTSSSFVEIVKHKENLSLVHIDVIDSTTKIPNHDVYLMNIQGMPDAKQSKMIKKIYNANPKASLFIIGKDNEETSERIKSAANGIMDSTKLNEPIQGFIDPLTLDFKTIVEHLASIEETKKRISSLWQKIEDAGKVLAS